MANLLCRAGFAGLLMSGCSAQSVPTVESNTKPTYETFARLGSWRPWQSAQPERQQPAPIVLSDAAPAPNEPALITPAQEKAAPPLKPAPVVVRAPKPAAPRAVPASMPKEPIKTVPALVSCRTHNEPGQRVRMECDPVD